MTLIFMIYGTDIGEIYATFNSPQENYGLFSQFVTFLVLKAPLSKSCLEHPITYKWNPFQNM